MAIVFFRTDLRPEKLIKIYATPTQTKAADLADDGRFQMMRLVAPLGAEAIEFAPSNKRSNSLDAFSGQMFAGKRAPTGDKSNPVKSFDAFSGQMFAGKRDWTGPVVASPAPAASLYRPLALAYPFKRSLFGASSSFAGHPGQMQFVNLEPIYSRTFGGRDSRLIDLYLPTSDTYADNSAGSSQSD